MYLPYYFVVYGCLIVVEGGVCAHGQEVEACVSCSGQRLQMEGERRGGGIWWPI